MDKIRFESTELTKNNIQELSELFPGVVTEGKANFDLLRSILGDEVHGDEAYEFTWVGKRAAIAEAGRPIRKTLRPCKEESKDWAATENLYIEGDNLDVLKLLQESYLGKVKMIYIDPPYNTGNDFVYRDNFTHDKDEYDEEAGVYDEDGDRLFRNTESNGRFHSDWCSMMYPRLVLARNMLRDDGVMFISIGDGEYHNLKNICNEVFGEKNYVATFVWDGGRKNDSKKVSLGHEYIVAYGKKDVVDSNDSTLWKSRKEGIDDIYTKYKQLSLKHHENWSAISLELKKWFSSLPDDNPAKAHKHYSFADRRGLYFASDLSGPDDGRKNRPRYTVYHPKTRKPVPIPSRGWRWEERRMLEEIANDRVHFGEDESSIPNGKVYLHENEYQAPSSVFYKDRRSASGALKKLFGEKVFDFPKDTSVILNLIELVCRKDDIILDFFSGSASTAEATICYNSKKGHQIRFIMVQLPEAIKDDTRPYQAGYANICEIGKERIRRAGEKIKAEAGLLGQDLDIGFRVLKLDSTNMQDVYYSAGEYSQDMLDALEDNIKEDRNDMDLLYACLLDWGLPLSMPHTQEEIDGFTVHTYNDGDLIACFDKDISDKVVKEIARRCGSPDREGLATRAVFRDMSFADSPSKINVEEIFKLLAPNTSVRVI